MTKITITEVAREAGVSIKTVSRVFNSEPNVTEKTRMKVLKAAELLGYHPNINARRLAANRAFLIGLLYDNPQSEYATGIQLGAIQSCEQRGFHLLIQPSRIDDEKLIEKAIGIYRQSTVDGFILIPPISECEALITELKRFHIPFVNVSQRLDPQATVISVDDAHASCQMTEVLIQKGHRDIGFIKGHPDHGSSYDRYQGYLNAMKVHHLDVRPEWVVEGLYDFDSGYACAKQLLQHAARPTAIFASNDHMALGVLTYAHKQGIRLPEELSVCGFDDSTLAKYAWPSLSTLKQPIAEVGYAAAEILIEQLVTKNCEPRQLMMHSEIILRNSIASPQH